MSAVRDAIAGLVAGGMDPVDAAALIVLAGAELAPPADTRSPGARRQAEWRARNKPSQNVSERLAAETSQSVTNRLETSQNNASPKTPLSTSKNLKNRERQDRGTRLAADWSPSDAERSFAKQEGFSDFEIGREINKFRDHWIATAGSKGVKLDWPATWRKWIRNSADWAGKAPPSGSNADATIPDSYYAKPDSEQLAAWDAFSKRTTGKTLARDRSGGWRVKSEWPPGHGTLQLDQPTHETTQ